MSNTASGTLWAHKNMLFDIIINAIILVYYRYGYRSTRRTMQAMWQGSLWTQFDFRYCQIDMNALVEKTGWKNSSRLRKKQ